MSAWTDIRDLIDRHDADSVAARVATLTADERREVAKQLPGRLKELRQLHDSWRGAGDHAEALRAAGAGTIESATSVASWLTRRGLIGARERVADSGRLLALVRRRDPAWQVTLAQELAGRLRGRDSSYELAAMLIRDTGIDPPDGDGFVAGWVAACVQERDVAAVLEADPLLDLLLPRVFRAQGVAEILQWENDPANSMSMLGGLCRLVERGRLDRQALLGECVARFLRGGTALELRFFVRLHHALQPASNEAFLRDYLCLLPVAPGPVAELALDHLREHDGFTPAELGEAWQALLFRPEKKLARAALGWLDRSARLSPSHREEAAVALMAAFAHPAYELQDRAVRLARRLGLVEAVSSAAHLLPPDLRRDFAASFPTPETAGGEDHEGPPHAASTGLALGDISPGDVGPGDVASSDVEPGGVASGGGRSGGGSPDTDPGGVAADDMRLAGGAATAGVAAGGLPLTGVVPGNAELAAPPVLPPMPPPLTTPGEIVATIERLTDPRDLSPMPEEWWLLPRREDIDPVLEWLLIERLMAALVTVAQPGDEGARDALSRVGRVGGDTPLAWITAACRDLATGHVPEFAMPTCAVGLDRLIMRRVAELRRALSRPGLPPVLLATPTRSSGHVDPGVLLARLEAVEAAGAEPLRADLQQALLRLPRRIDPADAARAARLGSEAGRVVAGWMAGDRPRVESSVRYMNDGRDHFTEAPLPGRVSFTSPVPWPDLAAQRWTGLDLIDGLFHEPQRYGYGRGRFAGWWAFVVPSDPEVAAAHLMPDFFYNGGLRSPGPVVLRGLAGADGGLGAACAVVLMSQLNHDDPGERGSVGDVLLSLAARGVLPGHELGDHLGRLVRIEQVMVTRAVPVLRELDRMGVDLWPVVAGALAWLIPAEGERPAAGLADLIALGVAGAHPDAVASVPGLAELAARKGSSRMIKEARRLVAMR
ncbi:DUF6493 family protein [Nonomuraea soli]|uniref:DUF7824 domain-containing protein n=1 Tax=Nonomuraea soli TaxID=1032476 RepID=A0A7W0CDY0_9ACTN|nr:DUF6493 family protein [Nonomuraea soli]MBA2889392.1 hypothetical protein [Nonomuraea soli]